MLSASASRASHHPHRGYAGISSCAHTHASPFALLFSLVIPSLPPRTTAGSKKLLKVIKQPVTKYLPTIRCRRVGFSRKAEKMQNLQEFVEDVNLNKGESVVFAVGVMSHGKVRLFCRLLRVNPKYDQRTKEGVLTCTFCCVSLRESRPRCPQIDTPWVDDMLAISEYPLSAACCISKITNALEIKHGIM